MYDKNFREAAYSKLLQRKPKFKIGDLIRVAIKRKGFEKKSGLTFSDEVFSINKIFDTYPVTYQLCDKTGSIIIGAYYDKEIRKVIV